MALVAGICLGPGEIAAVLRAGKTVEVCQARDTDLDHTLAFAALPAGPGPDTESHARSERDARTSDALNQQYICAPREIGQHHGSTRLVMERLFGETFARRPGARTRGSLKRAHSPSHSCIHEASDAGVGSVRTLEGPMRRGLLVSSILLCSAGVAAQQASVSLEPDTDRPGQNLRVLDLEGADPSLCAQACVAEARCLSFTYVKPGIQGPKARCWLKSGVPAPQRGTCCVSGVKTTALAAGKPPTPVKPVPGTIQGSPKPPPGAAPPPPTAGRPALSPDKAVEAKLNMLPASARQPARPLSRPDLVRILLANPQAAPRLQQMASTFGMPPQQLATRSTSGKVVNGVPRTVPPVGLTSNLDWEAGVRFTPKSSDGDWQVTGVTILEGQGGAYGLSDMYARDELLLSGSPQDVQVSFAILTPPGTYIVTVEFASGAGQDALTYDCAGCGWHDPRLVPVLDQQALIAQQVTTYIGQFQVEKSFVTHHSIRFPSIGLINQVVGVFRGITFTRF